MAEKPGELVHVGVFFLPRLPDRPDEYMHVAVDECSREAVVAISNRADDESFLSNLVNQFSFPIKAIQQCWPDAILEHFFVDVMKACSDFNISPGSLREAYIDAYVRHYNNSRTVPALQRRKPVQQLNYNIERTRKAS